MGRAGSGRSHRIYAVSGGALAAWAALAAAALAIAGSLFRIGGHNASAADAAFAASAAPTRRSLPGLRRQGAAWRHRVARPAALAPAPVRPKTDVVGLPEPTDEDRYGEALRWLMDEEDMEPPAWNILLLDKTFLEESNTIAYVTGCIVAVLGIAARIAESKATHARENYFALLETVPFQDEAFRKARALRDKGLLVRVTPKQSLPEVGDEDDGSS